MLIKVVSGGQSGVDVAALRAAKGSGLETGGWMPAGFETIDGARPGYAAEFGMREMPPAPNASAGYRIRTEANVRDSDATYIITNSLDSRGTLATWGAVQRLGRPHRFTDLACVAAVPGVREDVVAGTAAWIVEGGFGTLNVAGNRHTDEAAVEAFLRDLFAEVRRRGQVRP